VSLALATSDEVTALYHQSEALYRAGKYGEAAELLAKAYGLEHDPALLFNLGRCYERAGQLKPAVDTYQQYLEAEPQSKDRASVERSLATMRRQLEEIDALKRRHEAELTELIGQQVLEREHSADLRRQKALVAPRIITAGGAVVGLAGGACGALAFWFQGVAVGDPVQRTAAQSLSQAQGFASTANGLYIAAGAVALTGIVWWLIAGLSHDGSAPGEPSWGKLGTAEDK
jgi:tetratricopeptide (TPR) repeat protein